MSEKKKETSKAAKVKPMNHPNYENEPPPKRCDGCPRWGGYNWEGVPGCVCEDFNPENPNNLCSRRGADE